MSGEDSGVDAGSNASNESICMSLASTVSDYEREELEENHNNNEVLNGVNPNANQNNCNDSVDDSQQNDFGRNCCETRMHDSSSYMPSSSMAMSSSVMSSMASTSSVTTSSLSLPSIGSHCHYESLCSTSTSGHNLMSHLLDNHFEHHFFEETKPENQLFGIPNDYYYNNEEQHDYYSKMRSTRQKNHEIKRKHIFKDIAGERLLRRAANSNDIECVRKLLNEGIDPQSSDERNRTALHFAACKGNTQIARLLLEKGANPNQKDAIGNTALHLAVCTNNIQVITLLLSAGTDINSLDNSGRTPLHLAESKLKMIQSMQRSDLSINSNQLKSEVLQVLQMMSVYWHRSGKSAELELLTAFTNRLHLSQTSEEVGTDVKDLLTSLSHLKL